MVKNKKGGRNHRKQASKHCQSGSKPKLRLARDVDEMYARVEKIYGGGMADIKCNDNKVRLLHIRKKFRGRNRRDNTIAIGTMVLAGIRSWEVRAEGKKEKADLLYVYSRGQIGDLKKVSSINSFVFPEDEVIEDDGGFDISNTETWEDKLNEQDASANAPMQNVKVTLNVESKKEEDDEFDFDDI